MEICCDFRDDSTEKCHQKLATFHRFLLLCNDLSSLCNSLELLVMTALQKIAIFLFYPTKIPTTSFAFHASLFILINIMQLFCVYQQKSNQSSINQSINQRIDNCIVFIFGELFILMYRYIHRRVQNTQFSKRANIAEVARFQILFVVPNK